MADKPFSLDQLYQAVEQHLVSHLPGVQTVRAWPNIQDRIALPAVFLELAEIEPGADIGTGETTLVCKFEARIIVDPIDPLHQQQAVQLVTQLAVLLRAQTWRLAVEPAEFVQALQDWTQPALDGYTVWLVEWTQQVYVGPEEWPWPDQPPGTLLFGFNNEVREDFVSAEDM